MKLEQGFVILVVCCVGMVICIGLLLYFGYGLYGDLTNTFKNLNNLLCDLEDDTEDIRKLLTEYQKPLNSLSDKLNEFDVVTEDASDTW